MFALIQDSLTHTLMITCYVFVMMLVIEYLNVLTKDILQTKIRGSRWKQYLFAVLLGATPECLGAFAVVALYSHKIVSLGAVVAAMIATSGDEAFVMMAMIPETAGVVFMSLIIVGLAAGVLTDVFFGGVTDHITINGHALNLHEDDDCVCFSRVEIANQLRQCTLARGALIVLLMIFIIGLLSGQLGPSAWDWIRITLLLVSGIGLFIVSTVPNHFLETHLWEHVAKVHIPTLEDWGLILITALPIFLIVKCYKWFRW